MITKQNYVTLVVPILVAVVVVLAIAYAGASARRYDRLYGAQDGKPKPQALPLWERLDRLALGLSDGGRIMVRAAAVVGPVMALALLAARAFLD